MSKTSNETEFSDREAIELLGNLRAGKRGKELYKSNNNENYYREAESSISSAASQVTTKASTVRIKAENLPISPLKVLNRSSSDRMSKPLEETKGIRDAETFNFAEIDRKRSSPAQTHGGTMLGSSAFEPVKKVRKESRYEQWTTTTTGKDMRRREWHTHPCSPPVTDQPGPDPYLEDRAGEQTHGVQTWEYKAEHYPNGYQRDRGNHCERQHIWRVRSDLGSEGEPPPSNTPPPLASCETPTRRGLVSGAAMSWDKSSTTTTSPCSSSNISSTPSSFFPRYQQNHFATPKEYTPPHHFHTRTPPRRVWPNRHSPRSSLTPLSTVNNMWQPEYSPASPSPVIPADCEVQHTDRQNIERSRRAVLPAGPVCSTKIRYVNPPDHPSEVEVEVDEINNSRNGMSCRFILGRAPPSYEEYDDDDARMSVSRTSSAFSSSSSSSMYVSFQSGAASSLDTRQGANVAVDRWSRCDSSSSHAYY